MNQIPKHLAIIMDGNGRWAKKRHLPRYAGHKAGVDAVRKIIKAAANKGIEILTLFTFSSENWQRPKDEVSYILTLLSTALKNEVKELHQNNIQLQIIGDYSRFNSAIQKQMDAAQTLTANNTGLKVVLAINYGGQWDIVQATKKIAAKVQQNQLSVADISQETIAAELSMAPLPDPDLLVRSSGEQRISNFLLWQLAYTELFFTDILWPDFDEAVLDTALQHYANCERRFGHTSEQMRVDNA